MTTTTDLAPVAAALRTATGRFAALVESAPDPEVRIPPTAWTLRETAAHLVTVVPRYGQGARSEGEWVDDPRDLPELNGRQLQELGRPQPAQLAARLRADMESLLDQMAGYGGAAPRYRFHGGQHIHADTALGVLLGELLIHGWDISRVVRTRWPISADDVALVWHGVAPILPGWVDPDRARGHTASYAVHLRGGRTYGLSFVDGRLTVGPAQRVDAHVGGDPVAVLLALYRRLSPWRGLLSGRLVAWGRRPWLALSLCDRFCLP